MTPVILSNIITILGRTNCLLSSGTTWTPQKKGGKNGEGIHRKQGDLISFLLFTKISGIYRQTQRQKADNKSLFFIF
jgi:hypothetical protein